MLKKGKYRILLISIAIFGILSFSAKYFFYDYSAKLIGNLLFEIAQVRGNKNYSLQNREISFFPLERQLLIKNLVITPRNSDSLHNTMSYHVEIPEIFVDIKSLSDIYFRKKLNISGLSLKKPVLRIRKNATDATESKPFVLNANELYEKISRYLTELQVESFDLDSANLEFEDEINELYKLENFSLSIDKFSMDSSHFKSNKNPFFTENVFLKLSRQEFTLRDHTHKISFDSLVFSSGDSSFFIHNLIYKNFSSHDKQDSVNIPLVSLTRMDVDAFYTEKTIDLGMIQLKNPYMHLHPKEKNNNNQVGPLSNDSQYTYRFDSIWFTNGSLAYNHEDFLFQADSLNLHHGDYVLFPGSPLISMSQLVNNISTSGKDFRLKSENLNFTLSELAMDSQEDFLTIREIDLQHMGSSGDLNLKAQLAKVSKFEFHNRDFYEIDSFLVENPVIEFIQKEKQENPSAKSDKYVIIHYLNALSGSFNGQFNKNQLKMGGLDLVGKDLNSHEGLNNLERVKLLGRSYEVKINSESISGEEWSFNGMNNLLSTKNVYSKFGEVEEVLLYNPNYDDFQKNYYRFDSLIIKNADLTLTGKSETGRNSDFYNKVDYEKIRVEKSKLGWQSDRDRLTINQVDLTLYSGQVIHFLSVNGISGLQENIAFSMEEPHFQGSTGVLTANKIRISKGREFLVDLDSVHLDNFPASVVGLSLDSLSRVINRITLYKPDFAGMIKPKSAQSDRKPILLPPIDIQNGKIQLSLLRGSKEQTNIYADSIDFKTFKIMSLDDFLTAAENSEVTMKNISINRSRDSMYVPQMHIKDKRWVFNNVNVSMNALGTFQLKKALILNPGLNNFVEKNELTADSIITDGLSVFLTNHSPQDSTNGTGIENIRLPFVSLSNNDLHFYLNDKEINIPGLSLEVKNIQWAKGYNLDSILSNASIELTGSSFEYEISDIHSLFKTDSYRYSDSEKKLTIENLRSSPSLNKDEFMELMDTESDWINGSVDQVTITDFDIRDVLFGNKIAAEKINLKAMSLYIYRDKRLPDPVEYKPLPHSLITRSPFIIEIDSIQVESDRITYVEKNDRSEYLGRLFFSNVAGLITHVYSEGEMIRNSPRMTLKASGDIMNAGFFNTTVRFVTIDTSGAFTMKGEIGNMDLTKLNPILENSAQVSVNSGNMRRIEFAYEANNQYALGEMKFYYDDLKISVFNKDNLPKGLGASFKTFFANTFIVNKKNPHFLFVREGDIFFERLEERSIINYWARALLSGVVTSIGARNNKKEIRQLNQETKDRLENLSD